jgi:Zn-dependent protease with chaperone function
MLSKLGLGLLLSQLSFSFILHPVTKRSQTIGFASTLDGIKEDASKVMFTSTLDGIKDDVSKVMFKNLDGTMFAHPLDKQTTARLQSVPLLEPITRRLLGLAEAAAQLDNLSSSVLVGPKQMASIYKSLTDACLILDMEQPEVYIKQNPVPNAYTLAIRGRKPFIVLHSSIVELLSEAELQAVIAHELGHLKCEHSVWITTLNLLIIGINGISEMLTLPIQSALYDWLRSAEFSCDRAALLVSQDVNVVASVFMKLSGGTSNKMNEMNVEAYIEQAIQFSKESKKIGARVLNLGASQVMSHPFPVTRVTELIEWSKTPQYQGLIRRAQKVPSTPL